MRRYLLFLLLLSTSAATGVKALGNPLAAPTGTATANPWLAQNMDVSSLRDSMLEAADYLVRSVQSDGSFIYVRDPLGACCLKKADPYSMIRHAGAAYALLNAYDLQRKPEYLEAATRAVNFMLRFAQPWKGLQVVHGIRGKINIGEAGFLLLAMVTRQQLARDGLHAAAIRDHHLFVARNLHPASPYATKEQWAESQAAMALVRHHEWITPSPAALQVVQRWLTDTARRGLSNHWTIQSLNAWHAVRGENSGDLVNFGIWSGHNLMKDVITAEDLPSSRVTGSKSGKLLSCNVTARAEGLLAALALARRTGRGEDARFFAARVREHLAFARQFQYGQPHSLTAEAPHLRRLGQLFDMEGGLTNELKSGSVRIDYVAHYIRAIHGYIRQELQTGHPVLSSEELLDPPLGSTRISGPTMNKPSTTIKR